MALPVRLLEQLPPGVSCGLAASVTPRSVLSEQRARALALGIPGLDAILPDQGILRGSVVELEVSGRAALATSIALAACRAAQHEGQRRGADPPWCAFIDPTKTLFAPGALAAGVLLERLLVVRPAPEALSRTALRLTESRAFSVVVIDTVGVPGAICRASASPEGRRQRERESFSLGAWARVVRRLSLAVQGSEACVLLITDSAAPRTVPLPVTMRIALSRPSPARLSLRIAKDKQGRVTPLRTIAWAWPASRPAQATAGAHAACARW
jgi:recombination protein RecA